MENLNDLPDVFNFAQVSGIIILITSLYSLVLVAYEVLTKSKLEKSLTYRGKDRISSGILIFISLVTLNAIVLHTQLTESTIGVNIAVIIIVSVISLIIIGSVLAVIHIIFTWRGIYNIYEIRIYPDQEEYWEIIKVTKENKVILKKDNAYLSIPNLEELDYKLIRMKNN